MTLFWGLLLCLVLYVVGGCVFPFSPPIPLSPAAWAREPYLDSGDVLLCTSAQIKHRIVRSASLSAYSHTALILRDVSTPTFYYEGLWVIETTRSNIATVVDSTNIRQMTPPFYLQQQGGTVNVLRFSDFMRKAACYTLISWRRMIWTQRNKMREAEWLQRFRGLEYRATAAQVAHLFYCRTDSVRLERNGDCSDTPRVICSMVPYYFHRYMGAIDRNYMENSFAPTSWSYFENKGDERISWDTKIGHLESERVIFTAAKRMT